MGTDCRNRHPDDYYNDSHKFLVRWPPRLLGFLPQGFLHGAPLGTVLSAHGEQVLCLRYRRGFLLRVHKRRSGRCAVAEVPLRLLRADSLLMSGAPRPHIALRSAGWRTSAIDI